MPSFPPRHITCRPRLRVQDLAADLRVPAVRFLGWLLSYVWARFYSSEVYIDVEGLERIRQMAPEHILIYVPTHKSHLDYLLLSYILFNAAIPVSLRRLDRLAT